MSYDSRYDTLEHIALVRDLIHDIESQLHKRGVKHDMSKLESPEKEVFDRITPKLKDVAYGTDEYRRILKEELSAGIKHHYEKNSHHPEHERAAKEKWLPVVGYEDSYEVSNFGEVRSLDREAKRVGGLGDMSIKGKILTPHINPKGYLRLQLSHEGNQKSFFVHRFVAMAFIPNPNNKPEVNHVNGNKKDNRVTNLEWVTSSENQQHAYDTGLKHPVLKYVVICEELNIWTYGLEKMEEELKLRGYEKANAAAIWSCIAGNNNSHLGLTFTSRNIEEYKPESDLRFMSILDIIEMLCDWRAACERVGGDFEASLRINKERFKISDELYTIIEKTAREMWWI